MVRGAAKFLHPFASPAEVEITRRRQDALLRLYGLVKSGTGATPKESVCSALAKVAQVTSSRYGAFATWVQDVSSSTFPGACSVAAGVGVLRKLQSVREIEQQQTWVRRLVDVLDKMMIFRKGEQGMGSGTLILTELLLLVQELQPQMQDSLNRLADWVNFCGDHESSEERLDAYIAGCGLDAAPKLEELHRSACKFNAIFRPDVGMDSLQHMQELYTTLMGGPKWSSHVASHAMPLMHAMHLIQDIASDDIQYPIAFASFLGVVSLLQLEKENMLCISASGAGSTAVSNSDEMLPPPPSNEEYQAAPPAPPTNAEQNPDRRGLDQERPVDDRGDETATSRENLDPSSRSSCDVGSSSGVTEVAGPDPACSGPRPASGGAVADSSTAGMRGSFRSSRTASGPMPGAGPDAGASSGLNSRELASESAAGGEAGLPGEEAAKSQASGARGRCSPRRPHPAPGIPASAALGSSPDGADRRVEDAANEAAGVRADQGNYGARGSSRGPTSGSPRSAGTCDGRNAASTDSTEGSEESKSYSNRCAGSVASVSPDVDISTRQDTGSGSTRREERSGPRGTRGDSAMQAHNRGGGHEEGEDTIRHLNEQYAEKQAERSCRRLGSERA